jgi:hypothetical protein
LRNDEANRVAPKAPIAIAVCVKLIDPATVIESTIYFNIYGLANPIVLEPIKRIELMCKNLIEFL